MVNFIINELRKVNSILYAKQICSINQNTTIDKRPDIEVTCNVGGKVRKLFLDVTFTHQNYMDKRYQEKIKKHNSSKNQTTQNGNVKYNGTYPIVFGKNVSIHPESLKLLKTLQVNTDNIYQYLGFCNAKHHDLCLQNSNKIVDVEKLWC